jgi:hypothetical protein
MTEEKLKCLVCGRDLSLEFISFVCFDEPLICPKCGTKHKICFQDDKPILEPWGWDV